MRIEDVESGIVLMYRFLPPQSLLSAISVALKASYSLCRPSRKDVVRWQDAPRMTCRVYSGGSFVPSSSFAITTTDTVEQFAKVDVAPNSRYTLVRRRPISDPMSVAGHPNSRRTTLRGLFLFCSRKYALRSVFVVCESECLCQQAKGKLPGWLSVAGPGRWLRPTRPIDHRTPCPRHMRFTGRR